MLPLVLPLAFGGSDATCFACVACFACLTLAALAALAALVALVLKLDSTSVERAADASKGGGGSGGGGGGGGGDGSVFSTDASSCSTVSWLDEAAPGPADCDSPFIARRTGLESFVVIFCGEGLVWVVDGSVCGLGIVLHHFPTLVQYQRWY